MDGANTNFVTGPGLHHGSLINTHDLFIASRYVSVRDPESTAMSVLGPCRGGQESALCESEAIFHFTFFILLTEMCRSMATKKVA